MEPCAISVIIPVRNEGQRIQRAVDSLARGRRSAVPLQFVIVDDASDDNACASLASLVADVPQVEVTLIRLDRWSGIPAARNRGASAAQHPVYLVTDGNAEYPAGWDQHVWQDLQPDRALAATILDMHSPFRGYGCQLQLANMGVTWIPYPHSFGGYVPVAPCTSTVITRDLFHQLGGYDESLPLYGAAEPEFSVRLWLSGHQIINIPELEVRHRFRPRGEHDDWCTSIRHILLGNYLRFGCYYLPDAWLERTYAHYEARYGNEFHACMRRMMQSDVWEQRQRLARLPRQFTWLAERFSFPHTLQ